MLKSHIPQTMLDRAERAIRRIEDSGRRYNRPELARKLAHSDPLWSKSSKYQEEAEIRSMLVGTYEEAVQCFDEERVVMENGLRYNRTYEVDAVNHERKATSKLSDKEMAYVRDAMRARASAFEREAENIEELRLHRRSRGGLRIA